MVTSNKILTVSYGTFSCTLEGFDDSFDTMKAIAEYFRDLAQDDRYFGAEPPTPDAEMLARIAEREIARRVEARFEKGNLVLRPTDEAEAPHGDVAPKSSSGAALAGAIAAPGKETKAEESQSAKADREADPEVAPPTPVAVPTIDGVAAAAPQRPVTSEDVAVDESDDGLSFDLSGLDLGEDPSEDDAIDTTALDTSDDEMAEGADAVSADAEPETDAWDEDETLQSVEAEPVEPTPAAPVADSVADKLQRIRAVVASKPQVEPEYTEDEHAMSDAEGDEPEALLGDAYADESRLTETPADADAASGVAELDDESGDTAESEDDNLFTDTIAALVNDRIDQDEDEDEEAILADAEDETSDRTAEDEIEALRAKIAELEALAAARAQPEEAEGDEIDAASAEDDQTPVAETPEPIVARVGKAKRSDVEAALATGSIEEYEDDEDDDTADLRATDGVSDTDDSSLTAEQEAELARELADLRAEIDEDDDWNFDAASADAEDEGDQPAQSDDEPDEAEANIRKAVKMTSPGRAMLTDASIEEDDASVERLIDQTETEMDEPEGNRRRSAIAHLRAAVAATKADRLLGFGSKKNAEVEEPYREDLADAVRPRRPAVTQARSERPAPVRPAPLKLVAEQRVDTEAGGAETDRPVRPRRVVRSAEPVDTAAELGADDAGFADFAESVGANTLPELLEAAAAYMSFVEGHDQFSRPQLMTKLHQAEGEASSREERLRSFGQLLREGKIAKIGGGRFTASDSIGFKPKSRAAG